jgi:hypothetical protein
VPSADTMMLLDDAHVAGARLMVRKLANHDVVEVYQPGCGRGRSPSWHPSQRKDFGRVSNARCALA